MSVGVRSESEAAIEWWDLRRFAVTCPYCGTTHIHHNKLSMNNRYRLLAKCDSTGRNKYKTKKLKRLSQNEVYYEIDRANSRCIPGTAYIRQGTSQDLIVDAADRLLQDTLNLIDLAGQTCRLCLLPDVYELSKLKAFAGMRRGGGLPDVFALSGWKHRAEYSGTIAGREWTSKVIQLCQRVGFTLTTSPEMDHGVAGQHYASHVEMQLIAYFFDKHYYVFEKTKVSELDVGVELSRLFSKLDVDGHTPNSDDGLRQLWEANSHQALKHATIYVSRPVCKNCNKFAGYINKKFGLQIDLREACKAPVL